MNQKEANIRHLFVDQVQVRYLKRDEVTPNLRRFIGRHYHQYHRSTYPFFVFSVDALFLNFVSVTPLKDERILKLDKYFYDDYINFTFHCIRNYPFRGNEKYVESYFMKKETSGDYSLRGFLSNHNTSRNFIPIELSSYKSHIIHKFGIQLEDVEYDSDLILSAPIYIE